LTDAPSAVSALFGIGWGIAGFCPGPGLVALGMGEVKAMVFVMAILAGMGVFELVERRRQACQISSALAPDEPRANLDFGRADGRGYWCSTDWC
jgi:uncharacterized membrane protein YedE/YeeE